VARLERAVRGAIAERVYPYGLTTLQYTTLTVLQRHGAPLSNAQLARRAYMTPQAMSEVIDALEKKKLIRRNRHPTHRRLLPASLTAKGRRVLADCERAVDDMENFMLADLTDRERAAFHHAVMSAVRRLGAGFPHA
jgi:DNA-binding MarR family transcriptional regulator